MKLVSPIKFLIPSFAFILLSSPFGYGQNSSEADHPLRKKVIHAGWERPDSSDLVKHLKEMESTPYDGIILMLQGTDEHGRRFPLQQAFSNTPWKREWFAKNLRELQEVNSTKLTHNFIRISANPGDVDWFDDEGWTNIIEHWRIAAWLAKEGRLKGLCFDAEPYSPSFFQMKYKKQPARDRYSFAQYEAKARERGRQVMEAIKSEYPDMTLFTFFMNSYNIKMLRGESLENRSYSLYPAFINGWLDAAPPEMRFVDGCETAYAFTDELEFLRSANAIQQRALDLVASENREKYRRQVQVGFGIYLDAFVNPKGSRYYIAPLNGSRAGRLSAVLRYAARASDEYVWTWGEKHWWWPTKTSKVKEESWEQALPGVSKALLAAFKPEELQVISERLFLQKKEDGTLTNLLVNGSFSTPAAKNEATDANTPIRPDGWNPWQNSRGVRGTLTLDHAVDRSGGSGSARIEGIAVRGNFGQTIPVKAGQVYYISGWLKQQGEGYSTIRVRWKDTSREWVNEMEDTVLTPTAPVAENGWTELAGSVVVPGDASEMMILLGAFEQEAAENKVWFDDIAVYRLEPAYQ